MTAELKTTPLGVKIMITILLAIAILGYAASLEYVFDNQVELCDHLTEITPTKAALQPFKAVPETIPGVIRVYQVGTVYYIVEVKDSGQQFLHEQISGNLIEINPVKLTEE